MSSMKFPLFPLNSWDSTDAAKKNRLFTQCQRRMRCLRMAYISQLCCIVCNSSKSLTDRYDCSHLINCFLFTLTRHPNQQQAPHSQTQSILILPLLHPPYSNMHNACGKKENIENIQTLLNSHQLHCQCLLATEFTWNW